MKTRSRVWMVLPVLALGMVGGCVSQQDYDQLMMANRAMEEREQKLQQDLYDSRTLADTLRDRVAAMEREIETKDALVTNLQGENDRLAESFGRAQDLMQKMAHQPPSKPIVLTRVLPPALDSALKAFAAKYPDTVIYDEAKGIVKWNSDLLFALGSDIVRESALASLADFGEILKSTGAQDFEAVIVGHTDDRPISRAVTRQKHPTNWHLSAHRSISVMKVLGENDVPAERMAVMGCGEYRPVVTNDSDENRSRNRRVEIFITPKGTWVPQVVAKTPQSTDDSHTVLATPDSIK